MPKATYKTSFPPQAYFIGGGIGSLAAAAFMIRDGNFPGENITIFEGASVLGGSLDGAGNPETGYSLRGGRMIQATQSMMTSVGNEVLTCLFDILTLLDYINLGITVTDARDLVHRDSDFLTRIPVTRLYD